MSVPGMDKDLKNALEQGSQGVENLGSGSQLIYNSNNKVRGRHLLPVEVTFNPSDAGG